MLHSTDLLVSLLLTERHGDDLTPFLREEGRSTVLVAIPEAERPLVVAAGAIAAGEPKRALRALDGLRGPVEVLEVAAALRLAARTADVHLYPGGGAPQDMLPDAGPVPAPAEPGADLVVQVAARVIPLVQWSRAVAENALAGADEDMSAVYKEFQELGERLTSRDALCYLRLAQADVARRAGSTQDVVAPLAEAHRLAGDDPLMNAHIALTEGDWALAPAAHPDILSLSLTRLPIGVALPAADPTSARRHYLRAEELYASVGAAAGRAAVTLRLACLMREDASGDPVPLLRQAAEAAAGSGRSALRRVIETHLLLDRLDAGEDVPLDEMDALAAWSRAEGGDGFAQGIARLLLARARKLRESGPSLPAMRGMRLARRLAALAGAPKERTLAGRDLIDLISEANFRFASTVLLAGEAAQHVAGLGSGSVEALAWTRAADVVNELDNVAESSADPDLKRVAATYLNAVADAADRIRQRPARVEQALAATREAARQARPLILRYEGRRDEQAGRRRESRMHLQEALEALRDDDVILRIVLLAELGRRDEAHEITMTLLKAGMLHLDFAVSIFLILEDPVTAQLALQALDEQGWPPPARRPWLDAARRAELSTALGRFDEAVTHGARAIEDFETRSAGLVREVLRTSMTDDVNVAAMYHFGVMAHLGRAGQADSPVEADRAVRDAFQLADRCRGLVVDLLRALDALPDGAPRDAVGRWLRAGSAWAAAYESLAREVAWAAADPPPPEEVQRRILAVEDELEAAESTVAELAPQVLTGWRERRPGADWDEVRAGLTGDRVLLYYEAFGQDLVVWAAGSDGMRHQRMRVRERDLTADVRAFHQSCATGWYDQRLGERLTDLLLQPVQSMIADDGHLIVVPHRSLALLPFHALPWRGKVLGERNHVSHLPSAALLARPEAARAPDLNGPALLVGNPAYSPQRGLHPLGGSATEVAAIAGMLSDAKLLTGDDATEQAVRARAPGCHILHLATHGLVDELAPHGSYLALAGDDRLTVGDLMGLDLGADLVVLSACHTGKGTATAGGDIVGLVRAAVTAGARHVVVSLWPADDQAAALLMTEMYRGLAEGDGVTRALTSARRWVRTLDEDARDAAYETLRRDVGTGGASGVRDLRPEGPAPGPEIGLPYFWGSFVHYGV
ncbi:hypothetical protein GCM10009850_042580 [Nonomuraea monospora]|uniref:CHAT domain-containing protein n=1 Tax=Nonomuraea monospora TaxID=568818 RepID=A0ABN3CHB7_9ACTN